MITRSRSLSQPSSLCAPIDFGKKKVTKTSIKYSEIEQSDLESENMSGKESEDVSGQAETEILNFNPEEVTPKKWFDMFTSLNKTLTELKTEVSDLKGLKGKVEHFSTEWKESVDKGIIDLDNKCDYQDFQVKLLMNIVIRQDERIKTLEGKQTAAFEREIRPNLRISGIVEKKEETRQQLFEEVTSFFKNTMQIEEEIGLADAYRVGAGNTRSVVVKLQHPDDKSIIFANASNLKEKTNSKKKAYYVQQENSDQMNEVRQHYSELVRENKENDTKLTIKMRRGNIMVNNETMKAKVSAPTVAEIIQLTEAERETIRACKLTTGGEHVEKGSEFISYAVKVKSVAEVDRAYKKMRIKHAGATHVICAYRLDNPIGPYRQQAVDDGDFGLGRAALKVLKKKEIVNTCIFIVRYYGGTHLGKRRFEITEDLTEKAIRSLTHKLIGARRKSQRQLSQSSVTSALSQAESQEDEDEQENEQIYPNEATESVQSKT